jgi:hypothetical protein
MAFFKNTPDEPQSPPQNNGDAFNASSSHSARMSPVFKRPTGESSAPQQVPLPRTSHDQAMVQGVMRAGGTAFQMVQPASTPGGTVPNGQFLNTMDGEMTAGLERYFPSPLFRLRISQKRLITQMDALRDELEQYNSVPGKTPEMVQRQKSLQRRLIVLEYRESRVTRELSSLLLWGGFLSGFFEQVLHLRRLIPELLRLAFREWQRLTRGQAYISAAQANDDLRVLYQVLSTRINDPTVSSAELGRLINLYDRLYAKANKDLHELAETKKISLLQRLKLKT